MMDRAPTTEVEDKAFSLDFEKVMKKAQNLRKNRRFCAGSGTLDAIRTHGLSLRSETVPMNFHVPQCPYTSSCANSPPNGIERPADIAHYDVLGMRDLPNSGISRKLAKSQISRKLAGRQSATSVSEAMNFDKLADDFATDIIKGVL